MKQPYDQIVQQFNAILIEQLGIDRSDIKPEYTFESLGADSLDMVELVMAVESTFGFDIPDETAQNLITVQDFLTLIDNEQA